MSTLKLPFSKCVFVPGVDVVKLLPSINYGAAK